MSSSPEVAKQSLDLLQKALEESEARVAELSEELRRKTPTKRGLEKRLDILTHKLEKSEEARERLETDSGQLEEVVENANAKIAQLKAKLEIAESGPDKLTKKEINYWRAKAESFDAETTEYKERIQSLRHDVSTRYEELIEARTALSADEANVSAAEDHAEALNAATSQAEAYRQQIDVLTAARTQSDVERATMKVELDAAITERDQTQERLVQIQNDARKAAKAARAQDNGAVEDLKKQLQDKEAELKQQAAQHGSLATDNARLQQEFKEEKECRENLSEVANERLDELTKFREQYEEAEERHGEAEWRLGKAKHFERLVERRKGVISSLIAAIRTKTKANTALKAGVDSLRTHKASAQAGHQQLLARIEQLTLELGAAKEAVAAAKETDRRSQEATRAPTEDPASRARIGELEARVSTQAQVIKSLESRLQLAQDATPAPTEDPESRVRVDELEERVQSQIELIKSLEDELQVSKVVQLDLTNKTTEAQNEATQQQKAGNELFASSQDDRDNDRLVIDALEREVAELREALVAQANANAESAGKDDGGSNELRDKLKMSAAKIQKLTEVANAWKRKYEFLSTDAPAAYQTQAAAKE